MAFWACARLEPHREALALRFLSDRGFRPYFPRLREQRVIRGRRVETRPPLFVGYAFLVIELQWHAARWTPGVAGILRDGDVPAHVPDRVVDDIRSRERDGLVELPDEEAAPRLRPGEPVRVTGGPFDGKFALVAGMKPHQRVELLLASLGGSLRVTMPLADVEATCRAAT